MSCASYQRELSNEDKLEKLAHVSLRSFLIHTTLQKRTPTTRQETLKEETTLEEGCQNASLFSRISLFLCLLLLLLTGRERRRRRRI